MLVSSNEDYVNKTRYLSSQAREPTLHYEHKEVGYNYRLSNLLAAIGRAQTRLNTFLAIRKKIFDKYFSSLSLFEGFVFIKQPQFCDSNRWLTTLTVDDRILSRDLIIKELGREGIESRPVWKPMHLQPVFERFDYVSLMIEIFQKIFLKGLLSSFGSSLRSDEQDKVIDIIISLYKRTLWIIKID